MPANDLGYSELVNGQMGSHKHPAGSGAKTPKLTAAQAGELAGQLAVTAELVKKYPTIAEAKAAGYRQAGPFSPGLGTHFTPPGYGINNDDTMSRRDLLNGMLIFDGVDDDSPLAGFMYMTYQREAPAGFVGDLDTWHFHTAVCLVETSTGLEAPFGADLSGVTEKMCKDKGGSLLNFTGYMVHVWTVPGYESPEGTFSDLNPKILCPDGTYHRIPISSIGDSPTTCRV